MQAAILERRANIIEARRESFVVRYDVLMRLVEAGATRAGLEFGPSPHEAMRRCVRLVEPSISVQSLQVLSNARHGAKKNGLVPSHTVVELLMQVIELVRGNWYS